MKKYYKDYKLVSKTLRNGKVREAVEYTGKYYICRLSKTELTKRKVYSMTLALCSIIVMIGTGLINNSGSRVLYVVLPYACLFLPSVFCLVGVVRFVTLGNKLEFAAFDKSVNRIHKSVIGQLILSSLAATGDIFYLIFIMNKEKLIEELVFLSGMIVVLFLSIMFLRFLKKMIYETEEITT